MVDFLNISARRARALAVAATILCSPLAAAAPVVDLSARVTPTTITVGDPVRYEITVTHPAGSQVTLPAVRGNTGALEVLDYAVTTGSAEDGRPTATHVLTLAAYTVGGDTLPPQRVEVRTGTDTAAHVLYTPPTVLTVEATTPPEARDIADIHDGERLPRAFPWWIPLAAALVAGAAWGMRRWRARRALRPLPPAPAPRAPTAAETALARLDALARDGLVLPGGARGFAFALSEILREYLANRYGVDALEATTPELLERVSRTTLTPAQQAWLRDACEGLDGVKFADGALSAEVATRLVGETRTLVRDSSPRPGGATDNDGTARDTTDHPAEPEGTRA